MTAYYVKQWPNGKQRVAYFDSKARYQCPDHVDREFPRQHSDTKFSGQGYTETLSDEFEVLSDDGTTKVTKRVTVTKRSKVSEKNLPTCRCGKQFVKVGYRFRLVDEWHRGKDILGGIFRDATNDKTIEDRYFKTRKAALKHYHACRTRLS